MYTDTLTNQIKIELARCLEKWGLSKQAQVSLLTLSENATFIAEESATGRKIIIRVHRPDYHC